MKKTLIKILLIVLFLMVIAIGIILGMHADRNILGDNFPNIYKKSEN
jgi:uncharacterized protein YneF (UPF0154 family)